VTAGGGRESGECDRTPGGERIEIEAPDDTGEWWSSAEEARKLDSKHVSAGLLVRKLKQKPDHCGTSSVPRFTGEPEIRRNQSQRFDCLTSVSDHCGDNQLPSRFPRLWLVERRAIVESNTREAAEE
jgi:hypothetical protein